MSFLTRFFRRTKPTANIAQGRLQEVLTLERALPVPSYRSDLVSLKQAEDGLCILFAEGAWPDLIDNLTMQLESPAMRDFFDGARVRVESRQRPLKPDELEELSLLLARHHMVLNPLRDPGDGSGLVRHNVPLVPPEAFYSEIAYASPPEPSANGDNWIVQLSSARDPVLLIRHSIVAGQVVHYGGTIVVFGDISPAAEVIAERDVIVFGKCRGSVQAGASGNEDSLIAALVLNPTQARIAGRIADLPESEREQSGNAKIVRVRDGRIVVEPWPASG